MVWLGVIVRVALVLVVMMHFFGILHVDVLVDDHHHLRDRLGVALEHLAPELDVMQLLVEVVDNVPVINLYNLVTVSKVPFIVVMK
jgi:cyanophycinase-like exopeptidase